MPQSQWLEYNGKLIKIISVGKYAIWMPLLRSSVCRLLLERVEIYPIIPVIGEKANGAKQWMNALQRCFESHFAVCVNFCRLFSHFSTFLLDWGDGIGDGRGEW